MQGFKRIIISSNVCPFFLNAVHPPLFSSCPIMYWTRSWPPCPTHWWSHHICGRPLPLLCWVSPCRRLSGSTLPPWYQVLSHPPSPPSRAGHVTTVTSDGLILTCGGQNYFSCLALDRSDSTWRNHSSLDSLRHYSSHAVLPSGLYILGGFYSSSSSFLPTGATTWEAGPSLPGMTFDSCAVAISETKFLLIGGWLETTRVSEYNSETGSWETWPSLVQARAGHACARWIRWLPLIASQAGQNYHHHRRAQGQQEGSPCLHQPDWHRQQGGEGGRADAEGSHLSQNGSPRQVGGAMGSL